MKIKIIDSYFLEGDFDLDFDRDLDERLVFFITGEGERDRRPLTGDAFLVAF
jgi:hypothetical protein